MPITNGNPYFIKGERPEIGCLLIHGFTGAPINVMPIAKIMMKYGFTVYAPLLKGHGTDAHDLEKATYLDWIQDVKNAYNKLKESGCKEIIVYGHSFGGLLALNLAENEPEIKAVLPFGAPIRVHDSSIYYKWRFPHLLKYTSFAPETREFEVPEYTSNYDSYPIAKQKDITILMRMVEKNLGKIKCPLLVLYSKKDELVRMKSAWIICERSNAKRKEVILLKDSGHNYFYGHENDKVEEKMHSFLHNIGYTLIEEN